MKVRTLPRQFATIYLVLQRPAAQQVYNSTEFVVRDKIRPARIIVTNKVEQDSNR